MCSSVRPQIVSDKRVSDTLSFAFGFRYSLSRILYSLPFAVFKIRIMSSNVNLSDDIRAKIELLRQAIGEFQDFPKEGIVFRYRMI